MKTLGLYAIYTGESTNILTKGEKYKVHEMFKNGCRLVIKTGFAGVPDKEFKII